MKNKKGNYWQQKGKTVSIKISDGETIIFSCKNETLKKGLYGAVEFVCSKIEGWDFLANMVFDFLAGVKK